MSAVPLSAALAPLADEAGRFRMLALDQRESLRTMHASAGLSALDESLVEFKHMATETLSRYATAVLLDRAYGRPAMRARAKGCALILAADKLHHDRPGGPVTGSTLDHGLTPELAHELGADALKLIVIWRPDGGAGQRVELTGEFLELCRRAELSGIVEGVVRPADIAEWSDAARDDAIVTAARELATLRPDLYKAEVPSYGKADAEYTAAAAKRITAELDCPWVVLSSGVAPAEFPRAVRACCAGGASGFLAGRAVWSRAISEPDARLEVDSVAALREAGRAADGTE